MPAERDYVLGTHDAELQRLGVQHAAWRETVQACWRSAGIGLGDRALDIGCGPGYATVDLAEFVGPTGHVVGIERSSRFALAARKATQHCSNVAIHELDLMEQPIPISGFDAAWCRWVACFVSHPTKLVSRVNEALRPGGVCVFHEYGAYQTFGPVRRSPSLYEFVQRVMQSWRAAGGEPNIALQLPALLLEAGFEVVEMNPRVFCVTPADRMWNWPIGFIEINLDRMLELEQIEPPFAAAVRAELSALLEEAHPAMLTPMVLEIVARKVG